MHNDEHFSTVNVEREDRLAGCVAAILPAFVPEEESSVMCPGSVPGSSAQRLCPALPKFRLSVVLIHYNPFLLKLDSEGWNQNLLNKSTQSITANKRQIQSLKSAVTL